MKFVTRCPSCISLYQVDDAQLVPTLGRVRCGKCEFAFDAREELQLEPTQRLQRSKAKQNAAGAAENGNVERRAEAKSGSERQNGLQGSVQDGAHIPSAYEQVRARQPSNPSSHSSPNALQKASTASTAPQAGLFGGFDDPKLGVNPSPAQNPAHGDSILEGMSDSQILQLSQLHAESRSRKRRSEAAPSADAVGGDASSEEAFTPRRRRANSITSASQASALASTHPQTQFLEPSVAEAPFAATAQPQARTQTQPSPAALFENPGDEPQPEPRRRRVEVANVGFLRRAKAVEKDEQAAQSPVRAGLWAFFAVLLAAALAAQVVLSQRHALAAERPTLRPWIEPLANAVGLSVESPQRLGNITIENSHLSRLASGGVAPNLSANSVSNTYKLSFALFNSSSYAVKMPSLELALWDVSEQTLARKVFEPQALGLGADLPSRVELQHQVTFKVEVPAGQRLSGYKLVAFYP